MALDQFQMPEFENPDGTKLVWDSASKSFVVVPATDGRPDQSHATGGDNDLFDPFQHTEVGGNPTMEGYMASMQDDPPYANENQVKCPNCGEVGTEHECPKCGKDLTPEWNTKGQDNPFFDVHPDYNDASEFWTWPQNVPKKNELNYDDSFPSMSLSHKASWTERLIGDDPYDLFNRLQQLRQDEDPAYSLGRATAVMAYHPEKRSEAEQVYNTWNANPNFTRAWNDALDWAGHPQMPPETREMYKNEFDHLRQALGSTKTANDGWDDIFADEPSVAMRTEIGKWVLDMHNQLHIGHGMEALHDQIFQRDGLNPQTDVVAIGSVYNDGTADTQKVFQPSYFNLETAQQQINAAFGPVTLEPPIGMAGAEQKAQVFPPFEITGGQWFIPPNTQPITGVVWVKERSNGVQYQPNMILVCEHLRPEDIGLWVNGTACIVTATGGGASHAVYLAMTESIPVVSGIGQGYNKLETGNYVKIDPARESIAVMPGAEGDWSSQDKQQVWNNILEFQRQRGGSVRPTFSHIIEEENWRLANEPNLEGCPEDGAPMVEQDGEMVCHDCGHKQPIIRAQAGVAAIPMAAEALGGGAEAAGGIGGIGSLMNSALGRGVAFRAGENMVGGGGGEGAPTPANPSAPVVEADPTVGVISKTQALSYTQKIAFWSEVLALLQNALKQGWNVAKQPLHPLNPLGYVDDAAIGGIGAAQQSFQNNLPPATAAGLGTDEDEVGAASKNDGTNSTDEASNSGIEGKKEQGDSPEQLKDVDGGHDSQGSGPFGMEQVDPKLQDKALKAFHMNLPLVIEFSESDEPGSENPILQALDAMLEEAFPGYKDGTDAAGETTEHPQEKEEADSDEASDTEPDQKSEGADKKAEPKEASVWHFAYDYDPDYGHQDADWGMGEEQAPYVCPNCGTEDKDFGHETGRCQKCGEKLVDNEDEPRDDFGGFDDQAYGDYDMYGPDRPTMQEAFPREAGAYPMMQPTPAGGGNLGIQICPRCGQAHPEGTPCPVADVTTPLTTGAPIGPQAPSNKVITKWKLAMPSNLPALAPQQQAGAPAAPQTCPMCGCNHMPGTPCPTYDQAQQPMATGAPAPQMAYASTDDESHDSDSHDSDQDWTDASGMPLQEGAEYEMKTAASPIPDRVTIERILPENLTYIIHSGDVDFRDTITRDQLDLDGAQFQPVDFDNTGEDSMDTFPGEEMPPRPGDDALPQQDDISTPSTVVSFTNGEELAEAIENMEPGQTIQHEGFEPVSLDTYTGSYDGDAPDRRNWLLEDSSPVEVDPVLMAKMAGKNYSPREQREFIDEKGEARNLDRLDLEGTHYVSDDLGIADSLW